MSNLKRIPAFTGVIIAVVLILYVSFHFIFLDLLVDLWWFRSLKFLISKMLQPSEAKHRNAARWQSRPQASASVTCPAGIVG